MSKHHYISAELLDLPTVKAIVEEQKILELSDIVLLKKKNININT